MPEFIAALGNVDSTHVRSAAAKALGLTGPAGAGAVDALIAALEDNKIVAGNAARALGQIAVCDRTGPVAVKAVAALIRVLEDPGGAARSRAALALGRIGPAAAEAVPVLIAALRSDDVSLTVAAARALGRLGTTAAEALPALDEAAT